MRDEKRPKTLRDNDIATARPMGRRSALSALSAGAIALAGGALLVRPQDQPIPLCSDNDPSDPANHGRHCGSGCSDHDSGDAVNNGRHCVGPTGCSDNDSGAAEDAVNHGRNCH